ncbi:MAG: radical SAM protein [Candidatus Methanogranum gryphiswaldense]|nr:MAG: radical SAM protein [Candidatus Methanogranum sp. U3.2.1]
MEEDLIQKKAELILGGSVKIPEDFEFPFRVSHSTAGPGAGYGSLVFAFDRFRVKKSISFDKGDFELVVKDKSYAMTKNGKPFLNKVELKPVVYHCPEQAFFNLDQRCIYHCAYCTSPLLDESTFKGLTDDDIVFKVKDAVSKQKVVSVSLTSGVAGSVDDTVDRFVSCITALRNEFLKMPIGVEPYVSTKEHVEMLKQAGATEIKLNLEAPTKSMFLKVCPELDYDNIWVLLEYAVNVFGKGKVSSNIIFGMGETDQEIEDCFEKLCSMGVVPTVRALRQNAMNKENLKKAIGQQPPITSERVIYLANLQKRIMEKYHLDTRSFHTMCIECTCCDIVPFKDII